MSVPLALASWILRIPIIVHEQTRSAGFANVFVSRFAQTVAVTYPETKKLFSHKNVVVTGNPIRESVLLVSKEKPDWMTIKSSDPLIFISGGSQGSEVINTMISRCASVLLKKYSIIHQCGAKNDARNYKEELEAAKEKLSLNSQKKYLVREWISETELAWIYSNAHIAISRAGANTVQELSLRHIPTLYIPLPFAHNNEQFLNAKALVDAEEALLLQQKDLTPEELTATIETLTKKHDLFKRNLQASFPSKESGSPQLYKEVIRLVQP